ncbi:MAG: RtcB family protein [Bdellovibrionales bacterium]
MQVTTTEKLPIKAWLNELEDGAMAQARNLANLPFAFSHVALMPDCHMGYGMPIGGVLATKNVIVPNAVGVDIGCGMCAVQTNIAVDDVNTDALKTILGGSNEYQGGIRSNIPVGFNHQTSAQEWDGFDNPPDDPIVLEQIQSACKQLGTLGGGNHFIELQAGNDGYLWIMIHSGSRNIGLKIASHYNKLAQSLCEKWHSNVPPFKGDDGLAFFPTDTEEGQCYIAAMEFALSFALANRLHMIEVCKEAVLGAFPNTVFGDVINIHHNYAALENHFGENVWVHRKGATRAREGEVGIIPGSQGTRSYIVRGLGNPNSFMSCSHGAGRKMGRRQAQRELNLEDEIKLLDDAGVLHSIRTTKDLDEAPSAYKDIDVVMQNQRDLVEVMTELRPLAVVKG